MLKCLVTVLVLASMITLNPLDISAKEKDKDKKARTDSSRYGKHSPHKATLWALLPGGGQIYNKKFWKLPIVYAGFAVTGYFVITNRSEYLKYKDAYSCMIKEESSYKASVPTVVYTCEDPLAEKYSSQDLQTIRDYYRRNLELSFIVMGLWYILQMLDATVDAHLYHWDVDDDLKVRIDPVILTPLQAIPVPNQPSSFSGIKVSFKF